MMTRRAAAVLKEGLGMEGVVAVPLLICPVTLSEVLARKFLETVQH